MGKKEAARLCSVRSQGGAGGIGAGFIAPPTIIARECFG